VITVQLVTLRYYEARSEGELPDDCEISPNDIAKRPSLSERKNSPSICKASQSQPDRFDRRNGTVLAQ
jgi:hypothetical protein